MGKKRKKLPIWATVLLGIIIAIIVIAVVGQMSTNSFEKESKRNTIGVKLELAFNNSSAEYMEEYEGYYIFRLQLSDGSRYYAAGDENQTFIVKKATIEYAEMDDRIIYQDSSKSILTVYDREEQKAYLTLFENLDDLKQYIRED